MFGKLLNFRYSLSPLLLRIDTLLDNNIWINFDCYSNSSIKNIFKFLKNALIVENGSNIALVHFHLVLNFENFSLRIDQNLIFQSVKFDKKIIFLDFLTCGYNCGDLFIDSIFQYSETIRTMKLILFILLINFL